MAVKYNAKEDQAVRILLNPKNVKRIGITCRCGARTQHLVPKVLTDGFAQVVVDCPADGCTQSYGILGERIIRLNKDLDPDTSKGSPFLEAVASAPASGSDMPAEEKSNVEIVDKDQDIPFIPGTFTVEGTEHVN